MIEENRSKRKVKVGTVVSNKMQNTVVVKVDRTMQHPKYGKIITQSKKYYAHVEAPTNIGDTVQIIETRPLSKLKRWRVVSQDKQMNETTVS